MLGQTENPRSPPSSLSADAAFGIVHRDHLDLEHFGALYGACASMSALFRKIERLAQATAPVMILGESGAGKELVATTLHQLSKRSKQPFVAVNCGALPENLIESELFGHERGSFTGASRTHRGCFERAHGGTLFLDEITEMPVEMQVRLLRVLESGRFCRVGGDEEITADVRILAASNRDLDAAVDSGRLREDLMYRLCVIPLTVPPLRERDQDAMLLAKLFLQELNDEHGESKYLTAAALAAIHAHHWPGNVRELKNVVHRAFVLSDEDVDIDIQSRAVARATIEPHAATRLDTQTIARASVGAATGFSALASMPPATTPSGARAANQSSLPDDSFIVQIPVGMSLDCAEKALITATLRALSGSKTKAARVLGISLKTLYNRLQAYSETAYDETIESKTASGDSVDGAGRTSRVMADADEADAEERNPFDGVATGIQIELAA